MQSTNCRLQLSEEGHIGRLLGSAGWNGGGSSVQRLPSLCAHDTIRREAHGLLECLHRRSSERSKEAIDANCSTGSNQSLL